MGGPPGAAFGRNRGPPGKLRLGNQDSPLLLIYGDADTASRCKLTDQFVARWGGRTEMT